MINHIMNASNRLAVIRYIYLFLMVVLFATACEKDADDYVWEQRTIYQVGNCNSLVNLRKEPTTKSAIVAKLSKGTKLTVVETENDELSRVQTSEGSCGYLSRSKAWKYVPVSSVRDLINTGTIRPAFQ